MARSLPISHSRKTPRVTSNEDAVVVLADDHTRVPCMIIDRSEGGAQIKISRSVELPDEFRLVMGEPEVQAVCRIAWRVGSRVGCAFIAQSCDQGAGDEAAPEGDQKPIKSRLLKRPLIID